MKKTPDIFIIVFKVPLWIKHAKYLMKVNLKLRLSPFDDKNLCYIHNFAPPPLPAHHRFFVYAFIKLQYAWMW